MKFAALAASLALFASTAEAANDSFTLTGMGALLPPLTLQIEDGSEILDCKGPPQQWRGWVQCLYLDAARSEEIAGRYASQLLSRGWAETTEAAGLKPGARRFSPALAGGRCPPMASVSPAEESEHAIEPTPTGKVLYYVLYNSDVLCMISRSAK